VAIFFSVAGFYGLRNASRFFALAGLLGGVFFWGTVGATLIAANYGATGGWVYFALASMCALAHMCRRR
jgi:hypothetical protein